MHFYNFVNKWLNAVKKRYKYASDQIETKYHNKKMLKVRFNADLAHTLISNTNKQQSYFAVIIPHLISINPYFELNTFNIGYFLIIYCIYFTFKKSYFKPNRYNIN